MAKAGLRIIAGRWRSRRISAPPPRFTRPMPDRVKEAVFDVLGSWLATPGRIPPLQVLDLFAGSGSMGLEAASRGAVGCVFLERHPRVVAILRDNLDVLQAEPAMQIVAADAWTCPFEKLRQGGEPVGLVFVDPPYRDSRDTAGGGKVPGLLDRITAGELLSDGAVIVLHHERAVRYQSASGGSWTVAQRRDYGSTAVSFVTSARPGAAGGTGGAPTSARASR